MPLQQTLASGRRSFWMTSKRRKKKLNTALAWQVYVVRLGALNFGHRPHGNGVNPFWQSLCDTVQDDDRGAVAGSGRMSTGKKIKLTPEEAQDLAKRALKFKQKQLL